MSENNQMMSVEGQLVGMPLAGPESFSQQQLEYLKRAMGVDETVLYEGAYSTAVTSCQLSEPVTNFQYIKVDWQRGDNGLSSTTLETSIYPSSTKEFNHIGKQNQSTNYYYEYHAFWDVSNSNTITQSRTFLVNYPKNGGNVTTYQANYNEVIPIKIIGIHRISGGNT